MMSTEVVVPVRPEVVKTEPEDSGGQPKVIMSPEAAINEAETAEDDDASVEVRQMTSAVCHTVLIARF